MSTSATGRAAKVGGLVGRSMWRRFVLGVRGRLASSARRRELAEKARIETAEEAARVLGDLKGALMKIGQIVSFTADALPPAAQAALRTLQKEAPPMSFDLARGVIESELGGDMATHFAKFDEDPVAAASIGQVHRAVLHDGREVAVKVQYPGVEDAIEGDLKLLRRMGIFAGLAGAKVDQEALFAEVEELLRGELDYREEAARQQAFGEVWAAHPLIRIPWVVPEMCTTKVLVQEFVRGLDFEEFLKVSRPAEKQLAGRIFSDFVFDSLHIHRLFHGDPHPGNYLFQEDGGIVFLDYGCVRRFDWSFVRALQALLRSVVSRDRADFVEALRAMEVLISDEVSDEEIDRLWGFFSYHCRPFSSPGEYTYGPDFAAGAREQLSLGELRKLGLPRELVVFNRITFGLNALLVELGASADWHRIYHRYLEPDADHPPALADAGLELPERYMRSRAGSAD